MINSLSIKKFFIYSDLSSIMGVRSTDHSVLGKTMLQKVLMGKTGLREFAELMGHHYLK
jgi:hypothetical protein